MSKMLIMVAALSLSFGVVSPGFCGTQESAATDNAQSAPPAPAGVVTSTQAYDENGKPMTPEEFEKAYKKRMEQRSQATQNRLESKQSRWTKEQ